MEFVTEYQDYISGRSAMQAVVDMCSHWGAACMLGAAKFMSEIQIGCTGGEADYVG